MNQEQPKIFYRYYNYSYGYEINKKLYYFVSETPCGYWISSKKNYNPKDFNFKAHLPKWISKTSRKRFAYPTESEALQSFIARKYRQISILTNQLHNAKLALDCAIRDQKGL